MKNKKDSSRKNDLPTGLAVSAQRALFKAGIGKLKQLAKFSEADIVELHGIGLNALLQLRAALNAGGLSFAKKTKQRG